MLVASYPFLSIAQVAQAALEAEGIPAFFENAEIVNMDWLLGNAVGDVKLLVPGEHEVAARNVLAAKRLHESCRLHSDETDGTPDRCLSCDAPLPIDANTCPSCGWSFAADDEETETSQEFASRKPDDDEDKDDPMLSDASTAEEPRLLSPNWKRRGIILILLANLLGAIIWLIEWLLVESRFR